MKQCLDAMEVILWLRIKPLEVDVEQVEVLEFLA